MCLAIFDNLSTGDSRRSEWISVLVLVTMLSKNFQRQKPLRLICVIRQRLCRQTRDSILIHVRVIYGSVVGRSNGNHWRATLLQDFVQLINRHWSDMYMSPSSEPSVHEYYQYDI